MVSVCCHVQATSACATIRRSTGRPRVEIAVPVFVWCPEEAESGRPERLRRQSDAGEWSI